jgi:hypothetical protein
MAGVEWPMFTRKSTAIFGCFSASLNRIWCTSNQFQTTYGANFSSEKIKKFIYLIFFFAAASAHQDAETRFRKRCFAL